MSRSFVALSRQRGTGATSNLPTKSFIDVFDSARIICQGPSSVPLRRLSLAQNARDCQPLDDSCCGPSISLIAIFRPCTRRRSPYSFHHPHLAIPSYLRQLIVCTRSPARTELLLRLVCRSRSAKKSGTKLFPHRPTEPVGDAELREVRRTLPRTFPPDDIPFCPQETDRQTDRQTDRPRSPLAAGTRL